MQLGIDATDSEFDCSGGATGSWSNYYSISVKRGGTVSSEPWITTFSYRFKEANADTAQWWTALHTPATLASVANDPATASSLGNAFNCVVDGTCRP